MKLWFDPVSNWGQPPGKCSVLNGTGNFTKKKRRPGYTKREAPSVFKQANGFYRLVSRVWVRGLPPVWMIQCRGDHIVNKLTDTPTSESILCPLKNPPFPTSHNGSLERWGRGVPTSESRRPDQELIVSGGEHQLIIKMTSEYQTVDHTNKFM